MKMAHSPKTLLPVALVIAGLLIFLMPQKQAHAQFGPPGGGLPPSPMPPGGGLGPPRGGLGPPGELPPIDIGIEGALIPFLESAQIPKLLKMVQRLKDLRDRLNSVRNRLTKIRDLTESDFLKLDPEAQLATVLFGDAPWLEDLDAGLEELEAISYTLDDIREITADVYPGDLPYDEPMEERLDKYGRKLSTARNAISAMQHHYEQMEEDRTVIENLAQENQAAEGRRQLMQAQTRVLLHQTKNARLLRRQIATLVNLMATRESQTTSERLQRAATARKAARAFADQPWTNLSEMPNLDPE